MAIHQHMIEEQPRIMFLHYWGKGSAADPGQIAQIGSRRAVGNVQLAPRHRAASSRWSPYTQLSSSGVVVKPCSAWTPEDPGFHTRDAGDGSPAFWIPGGEAWGDSEGGLSAQPLPPYTPATTSHAWPQARSAGATLLPSPVLTSMRSTVLREVG